MIGDGGLGRRVLGQCDCWEQMGRVILDMAVSWTVSHVHASKNQTHTYEEAAIHVLTMPMCLPCYIWLVGWLVWGGEWGGYQDKARAVGGVGARAAGRGLSLGACFTICGGSEIAMLRGAMGWCARGQNTQGKFYKSPEARFFFHVVRMHTGSCPCFRPRKHTFYPLLLLLS